MSNGDVNLVTIVGLVIFVGIWGYAFYRWGLLKGLMLGWAPSIVGAGLVMVGLALLLPH